MLGFKQITSTLAFDKYQTTKYLSERTGFTIVLTEVDELTVRCCIVAVTEPENNEGYVHALEHLIVNGSQKYPYKGVLDKITDDAVAWSEVDHIALRFSITEHNKALAALPIFLDHFMFPLLSEEDFLLDVHHIDGEGNDCGLVYEEMKEAYLGPYKMMLVRLFEELYPNSGYSWDYCGSESALRSSTTNAKIKEFHKKYFRPENITILVTGQLNYTDILKVVADFEDTVIAEKIGSSPEDGWIKPWQTKPPPPNYGEYNNFRSIRHADVEEHEKDAYVAFAWRGPELYDSSALKELAACEILLHYLSYPNTAPLHKQLVDVEERLAGTVSDAIEPYKTSLLRLTMFNVPVEKVEQTKLKTLECLNNIRNGVISIDMDRILEMVKSELNDRETKPLEWINIDITTEYIISLYLETDEFSAAMNPQWRLKELLNEPADYWLDIFRKYITEDFVLINSIPTGFDNEDLEEKQRIEKQRETLGEKGLAEKARILEKAKKYREVCLQKCSNFQL